MKKVSVLKTDWHRIMNDLGLTGQAKEFARNLSIHSAEGNLVEFMIDPRLAALGDNGASEKVEHALKKRFGKKLVCIGWIGTPPIKNPRKRE